MKTTTLGWMADKNHATIIHSCKTIEQFLEIRDPMTIKLMEEWVKVFNALLGSSRSRRVMFEESLSDAINLSGLPEEVVKKMLIEKAEEISL